MGREVQQKTRKRFHRGVAEDAEKHKVESGRRNVERESVDFRAFSRGHVPMGDVTGCHGFCGAPRRSIGRLEIGRRQTGLPLLWAAV